MKSLSREGIAPLLLVFILAGILAIGAGGYVVIKKIQIPQQPLLGGDKDIHGCIGSAGYSWCEAKQKCLRTWEEECEAAVLSSGNNSSTSTAKVPFYLSEETSGTISKYYTPPYPVSLLTFGANIGVSGVSIRDIPGDSLNKLLTLKLWIGTAGYSECIPMIFHRVANEGQNLIAPINESFIFTDTARSPADNCPNRSTIYDNQRVFFSVPTNEKEWLFQIGDSIAGGPVFFLVSILPDGEIALSMTPQSESGKTFKLSSGLFLLPTYGRTIDWVVENHDITAQTIAVTIFRIQGSGKKIIEVPGIITQTLVPGQVVHNANAYTPGYYYEVIVETESEKVLPSVSVWSDQGGSSVIPGTEILPVRWIKLQ